MTALKIPKGMRDFTLFGQNAKLYYTRPNFEVTVVPWKDPQAPSFVQTESCLRCEFRDIFIDWDWTRWRIATLSRLLARSEDKVANTVSWQFEMLSPPNPSGGLNTDTLYSFQSIHPVDWQTLGIGVRGMNEFYLVGATAKFGRRDLNSTTNKYRLPPADEVPEGARDNPLAVILKVTDIDVKGEGNMGPNIITGSTKVTITFKKEQNPFGPGYPWPLGSLWMIKHLSYEVHGIRLYNCVHCSLTNVAIISVPGKAVIIDRGSSNIHANGLSVDVNPPTLRGPRPMSGAADGVFASQTLGSILVENSHFGYNGDDAINVFVPTALAITYPNKIGTKEPDYSKLVLTNTYTWKASFAVGDYVEFLNASSLATTWITRKITAASYNSAGGIWHLNLDSPVPNATLFQSPPTNLGLVNRAHITRNIIIRNVTTHNHRARGFVLQIRDNAVVERCTIDRVQMAGIMIRACAANWEGFGIRNVVLGYNTLKKADVVGWNGAIEIEAMDRSWQHMASPGLNANITVRNNQILQANGWSVTAQSVAKVAVVNNKISVTTEPPIAGNAGNITVTASTNVTISGNLVCYSACDDPKTAKWAPIGNAS